MLWKLVSRPVVTVCPDATVTELTGLISLDDIPVLLTSEMGFVAGALAAGLRKAS